MAKAKAKTESDDAIDITLNVELDEPQRVSVDIVVITQGDLHAAFYAAVKHDPRSPSSDKLILIDAEKAQSAIDLFDKYKAIAGGLKPGQAQKYNDLKRMVKGR